MTVKSADATVSTWEGRNVILWPNDTAPRHAHVLSVDAHGWEFEIIGPDRGATKPGYRVGDRLYVSHSHVLTMTELDDD